MADSQHQDIIIKSRGKFGNKRIRQACNKIISGEYALPEKLIWCYIREGRIDAAQFEMLLDAVKQTVK